MAIRRRGMTLERAMVCNFFLLSCAFGYALLQVEGRAALWSATCWAAERLYWAAGEVGSRLMVWAYHFYVQEVAEPQTWTEWLLGRPPVIRYHMQWDRVAYTAVAVINFLVAFAYVVRPKTTVRVATPKMIPESIIAGSHLMENGREPACQFQIAVKKDDALCVIGGAIRMENYLVTPTHNLQQGETMYAMKNGLSAEFDMEGELLLAADVSAIPILPSTWSKLKISSAKLGPLGGTATVTTTSSCDKKYSVGSLKPSRQMMGRTVYDASTVGGFSGSAYMNGNVCVGMHCHGGMRGGGYEGLYLWSRLKLASNAPPESSEDFLLATTKSQAWQMEELHDAAVVRMDSGQYHTVTSEELVERLRNLKSSADWADQMEYEEVERELDRRYEPECLPADTFQGEGRRPVARATPGPSVTAQKDSVSQVREDQPRPISQPGLAQKSKQQRKKSQLQGQNGLKPGPQQN
nr:hypothetical protein 1 [Virus sp.]